MHNRSQPILRELKAIGLLFLTALITVSLFTHSAHDPGINTVVSPGIDVRNLAGIVGAYLSSIFVDLFGFGAYFFPLLTAYLAVHTVRRVNLTWWQWAGLGLICLSLTTWAGAPGFRSIFSIGDVHGSGLVGGALYDWCRLLFRPLGSGIIWTFIFIAGVQLTLGFTWEHLFFLLRKMVYNVRVQILEQAEKQQKLRAERKEEKKRKAEEKARIRAEEETQWQQERKAKQALKEEREKLNRAGEPSNHERVSVVQHSTPAKPVEKNNQKSFDDEEDFIFDGFLPEASTSSDSEQNEDEAILLLDAVGDVNEQDVTTSVQTDLPIQMPPKAAKSRQLKKPDGPALPSTDVLTAPTESDSGADMDMLRSMSESLLACLADFGVKGEVTNIKPGPVVTMFEFKPAPGVKISKIAGLSDDLALSMKALAVRIDAVPGQDVVGVEIPNARRETVFLREVLESEVYNSSKSYLTLALGKDIQGLPFIADLAKMPHMLVAGATGAGKSVCLNCILLSMLYKASPDQVKLLLVDPKRIELSTYSRLPHLVHPVVTEMALAKSALDWAVAEMDRRYQAMATLGVRNIDGYNKKLPKADLKARPELAELEPIPYLVIVIDELADLMMTAGKEAEAAIVRLAQLARAAGIHLILATQRPSVDVVTGLIKANFPSRLAFQVTSKHDSRTILDLVGAEKLLGRGDSLFKPSGGKVLRVHGAYVDEDEIGNVVDFWTSRFKQKFDVDFEEWSQDNNDEAPEGEPGGMDSDPMYNEAVDFVISQGKASISLVQRRFRIGFNRAARIIDQMEIDGMLGPQEGSKPRAVIKGRD